MHKTRGNAQAKVFDDLMRLCLPHSTHWLPSRKSVDAPKDLRITIFVLSEPTGAQGFGFKRWKIRKIIPHKHDMRAIYVVNDNQGTKYDKEM